MLNGHGIKMVNRRLVLTSMMLLEQENTAAAIFVRTEQPYTKPVRALDETTITL